MATSKRRQYHRVCTACQQAFVTTKHPNQTKTGWCHPCALHRGMTVLERFWRSVDKETACTCHDWENRCWPWTGTRNVATRYGMFSVDQKRFYAHVFAYTVTHGPPDKGLRVLHTPPCLLRHCVRHLYAGTQQQNVQDAVIMRRRDNVMKVPPEYFAAIKAAFYAGTTPRVLAEHYQVTPQTIRKIIRGQRCDDPTRL